MNPIFDYDLSLEERITYINNIDDFSDDLKQLTGMYEFSGVKNLQTYLVAIATKSTISSLLKIDAVRSLFSFQEYEEIIHKKDDEELVSIKEMSNESIRNKNKERQKVAYTTLAHVCNNFDDNIATPYKVGTIMDLMKNEEYFTDCLKSFMKIIQDSRIDNKYRYKTIISLENADIKCKEKYSYYFLFEFACNKNNDNSFRILSIQNLLNNCNLLTQIEKEQLCNILQDCASSSTNEYNVRADASDTLINNGINEEYKTTGRTIIKELSESFGKVRILYDNAQNVHVSNIEKSASEILLFLKTIETERNYSTVYDEISCYSQSNDVHLSLERILLDKNLYNNMKLSDIVIKLWAFMNTHEHKEELIKRLIEELEEMSGTCSTGFFTRLVNSISGFEENLNLKISFEDQIVANFVGRLNKKAKEIIHPSSPFHNEKKQEVMKLYLDKNNLWKDQELDKRIKLLLETEIEIIQDFSDTVLIEMSESSNNWQKRLSFLLFFRTNFSILRNELWEEFKTFITDTDFDLYFRKAIYTYEGEN
jgi:hypothetical protein